MSTASKSKASTSHKRKRQLPSVEETDDDASVGPVESGKKRVRWNGEAVEAVEEEEEVPSKESSSEEEEIEDVGQICLSITCSHGRLAAAYYDPTPSILYMMEDTIDSSHYDITIRLLEQIKPELVIVSSKSDEKFMKACRDFMLTSGGTFQIRPSKEFHAARGLDRLLTLPLLSNFSSDSFNSASSVSETMSESGRSEPRNAYDFMMRRKQSGDASADPTASRWNASIRLGNFGTADSPLCMSVTGALLDQLARSRAAGDLDDEGIGGLDIRGIRTLALDEYMQINADALSSLQIFEDEGHAYVHSNKYKEGLSLFGILNNTHTSLGRSLLRQWFLRPSLSIPVITARHDAISCFLRGENLVTADTMHSHLKGLKNVPRVLGILRAGKASLQEWTGLVKFTYHSTMLREAVNDLSGGNGVPIIQQILTTLDIVKLNEIGRLVNESIDWDSSENERRISVRQHVDQELDEWKRVYHGLDSLLSKVALTMKSKVPEETVETINVLYFPQIGYLICVPLNDEWREREDFDIEGWTYQFSSDDRVYFKSQEMHDLDQHIGDLHTSIADREIEIIHELQEKVLAHDGAMIAACETCAELDCLLSFAAASRAYDFRRPRMTDENVIDIKKGRHPLQEQCVDTFVANDAHVEGGAGAAEFTDEDDTDVGSNLQTGRSIVICTGANACGKSVYLKQNALISFMAQIGCFVPAESATLGLTDKIFTRLQTRESVSKVQSAFMIDLNQISFALRNCTSRSLLILDEFGKGTISSDGAGLFYGVIKHLLDKGQDCPKVFASTHFYEIFHGGFLNDSLPISYAHMEVLLTGNDGKIVDAGDEEGEGEGGRESKGRVEISYLYRVSPGLCLNSYATKCALMYGIPRPIVERAQLVSDLLAHHEINQLLDQDMSETEKKDLKDAEAICRRFLAWDLSVDNMGVRERVADVLGIEGKDDDA